MNKLIHDLEQILPEGMDIPEPLKQLYNWIEENNLSIKRSEATIGLLYPFDKMKESWTDDGREGGTDIEFHITGNESLKYWFGDGGNERKEITSRLCVFAQSGGDGSMCALWKDDNGNTQIVHMGSGSGSILCCVLADDAVDFLRLLAIGYDEICWDECFPYPPNHNTEFFVKPNIEFQNWVKETFNVTIPQTALEVVKHPAQIDDDESEDAFFNWRKKNII